MQLGAGDGGDDDLGDGGTLGGGWWQPGGAAMSPSVTRCHLGGNLACVCRTLEEEEEGREEAPGGQVVGAVGTEWGHGDRMGTV